MNAIRNAVIEFLETISDIKNIEEYQNNVPNIVVGDELACQWFDDLFIPDSKLIIDGFNENEIKVLQEFNNAFSNVVEVLPGQIKDLMADKNWTIVINEAKKALSCFNNGERATELLKDKVVSRVFRNNNKEFGIEFTDGTRLFIDHCSDNLEISIT